MAAEAVELQAAVAALYWLPLSEFVAARAAAQAARAELQEPQPH